MKTSYRHFSRCIAPHASPQPSHTPPTPLPRPSPPPQSVVQEAERLQESEARKRIATLVSRMAEMEDWFNSVKAEVAPTQPHHPVLPESTPLRPDTRHTPTNLAPTSPRSTSSPT